MIQVGSLTLLSFPSYLLLPSAWHPRMNTKLLCSLTTRGEYEGGMENLQQRIQTLCNIVSAKKFECLQTLGLSIVAVTDRDYVWEWTNDPVPEILAERN